ncbi:microtubule-associated tumor suppressor 1 homolog [Anolis carolinensis]|uniref:microtubule-associated tumor suppressor 1 homolog n=1 Tax=Anolis carolinensis TaxID=28377 RepID=UPI000203970C
MVSAAYQKLERDIHYQHVFYEEFVKNLYQKHQRDLSELLQEHVEINKALLEKTQKLQQENEELKVRMDRQMELSRQLTTEQAAL